MSQTNSTKHDDAKAAGFPPLVSETELKSQDADSEYKSPSDPDSEDPITRSVQAGMLDKPADSHWQTSNEQYRNEDGQVEDMEASGELQALRTQGRTVGLDMDEFDSAEDDDETSAGMHMDERLSALHPYGTLLGMNDLESVLAIERACFSEEHAATREKIQYRLSRCGELTFGIFSSASFTEEPKTATLSAATAPTSHPPDSADPTRKGILLAALVATKTTNENVQDSDMHVPTSSPSSPNPSNQTVGHDEAGRTLALHSLAVLPDYQGLGVGKMLMKAYVQRMVEAEVADRIALLTYPKLVPWYEKFGFEKIGESKATHGGGGWIDMVLEFEKVRPLSSDEEDEDEDEEEGQEGASTKKSAPVRRVRYGSVPPPPSDRKLEKRRKGESTGTELERGREKWSGLVEENGAGDDGGDEAEKKENGEKGSGRKKKKKGRKYAAWNGDIDGFTP